MLGAVVLAPLSQPTSAKQATSANNESSFIVMCIYFVILALSCLAGWLCSGTLLNAAMLPSIIFNVILSRPEEAKPRRVSLNSSSWTFLDFGFIFLLRPLASLGIFMTVISRWIKLWEDCCHLNQAATQLQQPKSALTEVLSG